MDLEYLDTITFLLMDFLVDRSYMFLLRKCSSAPRIPRLRETSSWRVWVFDSSSSSSFFSLSSTVRRYDIQLESEVWKGDFMHPELEPKIKRLGITMHGFSSEMVGREKLG